MEKDLNITIKFAQTADGTKFGFKMDSPKGEPWGSVAKSPEELMHYLVELLVSERFGLAKALK